MNTKSDFSETKSFSTIVNTKSSLSASKSFAVKVNVKSDDSETKSSSTKVNTKSSFSSNKSFAVKVNVKSDFSEMKSSSTKVNTKSPGPPPNKAAGTDNSSPTTNPVPLVTTVTDEIDVSVSNVTSKRTPVPDNEPVAATSS